MNTEYDRLTYVEEAQILLNEIHANFIALEFILEQETPNIHNAAKWANALRADTHRLRDVIAAAVEQEKGAQG